jgi:hypothetical protein
MKFKGLTPYIVIIALCYGVYGGVVYLLFLGEKSCIFVK